MESENLIAPFKNLLAEVQSLVNECKTQNRFQPEVRLLGRCKTDEVTSTETGVYQRQGHFEYIQKKTWIRAEQWALEQIKGWHAYSSFRSAGSTGKVWDEGLEQATSVLIGMMFLDQPIEIPQTLEFLLKALRRDPVPAWIECDVFDIILKTKSISLYFGKRRLLCGQLDVPDFEHEFDPFSGARRERFMPPPNCILRVEMETPNGLELQREASQVLVLLRLFNVCSVEFGQQTLGTSNPFTFIGGTLCPFHARQGRHDVVLRADAVEKMEHFWQRVEPRLPVELSGFDKHEVTPLAIAYKRYCDGLFTNAPVEAKIASAIMGLESLYFRREETQELSYRLALRVSKVLSKLDMNSKEIQRQIKTGYGIRSLYVHGSHLSPKEREQIPKKAGVSAEDLAFNLLDYLRISMLHLICSGQQKADFLDMVESSLVSRQEDEKLESMLKDEKAVLRVKLP